MKTIWQSEFKFHTHNPWTKPFHLDLEPRSQFDFQGHNNVLPIKQRLFDSQSSNFIHIILGPSPFTLTLIQGQILILKVTTKFYPLNKDYLTFRGQTSYILSLNKALSPWPWPKDKFRFSRSQQTFGYKTKTIWPSEFKLHTHNCSVKLFHLDLDPRSNFHSQGHIKLLPIEQRLFDLQSSYFIDIMLWPSSFTLTLTQGQIFILKVTSNFCL